MSYRSNFTGKDAIARESAKKKREAPTLVRSGKVCYTKESNRFGGLILQMRRTKMKHKKTLAALALTVALTLTGCGQSAAVTIDGVDFTQADYEGVFLYSKSMMDIQLAMYGVSPEMLWSGEEGKEQYNQQISNSATQQLTLLAVFENQMKKAGLKLDEAKLDELMEQQDTQLGGAEQLDTLLEQMKLTRDQYRRMVSVDVMLEQLRAHYAEKDADAMRKVFDEEFLHCKHILVNDEEGTPEKEALAKEIAEKAKNGADFDELIAQYNEDPGMTSNPDGYIFTDGEMVQPFYDGTKALEMNGISDPVRSNFGWHIILRLPMSDEDYEANKAHVEDVYFNNLLTGWMEAAKVTMSPEAEAVTFETLMPPAPEEPVQDETAPENESPAEEPSAPESETPAEDPSAPQAETPAEEN